MLEALLDTVSLSGFVWLCIGSSLAGIVRGFTGFGTAMVYLPFAGAVLGPVEALTTVMVKDVVGPLIHVPRAVRDGTPADVLRLAAGALLAVPLGVWALTQFPPEIFRWAVSLIALALLALLVAGFRYRGKLTKPLVFGTGGIGGFLAGCVGLPGPPVIMLYMASTLPVAAVRANLTLYLILADIIVLAVLWIGGLLAAGAVLLGVALIIPYTFGNWVGARLFRPEAERVYRTAAYIIIAGSALMGLPLWEG